MKRSLLQTRWEPTDARRQGGAASNSLRREQLLKAAASVILDKGAGNLTLEAVCEIAHVSKGGLLYYFDGKAALLAALVDDLIAQLEGEVDQQLCADATAGVEGARAYLRAVACLGELPHRQQLRKVLAFICAAYPELIRRVRSGASRRSKPGGAQAMSLDELHLRLLADGLWLADLDECYQITPERRLELLELCGETMST